MEEKRYNIGIVTWPIGKTGTILLSNLVDIFRLLSDKLFLITGDTDHIFFVRNKKLHIYKVGHRTGTNTFSGIINYVWTQLRISYKLMRLSRNVDLWIFFIGGASLIIPMLTAKLLRKRVILASAGSGWKVAQANGGLLDRMVSSLEGITHRLSDRIIIYSTRLITQHDLDKYRGKILIARKHFLDFDKFKVTEGLARRQNLVGYIGTLSKSKGVSHLLEAVPLILEKKGDIQFLLGGTGEMEGKLTDYIKEPNLKGKVSFVGWIPHDELPKYLNRLKLLVLPSYTEGLPNIILEAMACGTPILATPVGAIPDIIQDGKTGFIMEDNSPECIAGNIIRTLSHPDLGNIAQNARALVERDFTYEAAVAGYRKILRHLTGKH